MLPKKKIVKEYKNNLIYNSNNNSENIYNLLNIPNNNKNENYSVLNTQFNGLFCDYNIPIFSSQSSIEKDPHVIPINPILPVSQNTSIYYSNNINYKTPIKDFLSEKTKSCIYCSDYSTKLLFSNGKDCMFCNDNNYIYENIEKFKKEITETIDSITESQEIIPNIKKRNCELQDLESIEKTLIILNSILDEIKKGDIDKNLKIREDILKKSISINIDKIHYKIKTIL